MCTQAFDRDVAAMFSQECERDGRAVCTQAFDQDAAAMFTQECERDVEGGYPGV